MRLVQLNTTVGMKTVVYDTRLYSNDPVQRNAAVEFWMPVRANIAAWTSATNTTTPPQWDTLKLRWTRVRTFVESLTGVPPFANFLPRTTTLNKALVDLPGVERLLSFAIYGGDNGASLAQQFDLKAKLMCAVNELDHNGLVSTPAKIRSDMDGLKLAGCDQILVFGGYPVYDNNGFFADSSVVDLTGAPTNRAPATQEGSGHSVLIPVAPARILETRAGPGLGTVDGGFNGIGIRPADSVLELGIVGRATMPEWARSVVLNVTVTGALGSGYLTVYPCGETRPTSSNLNYEAGTDPSGCGGRTHRCSRCRVRVHPDAHARGRRSQRLLRVRCKLQRHPTCSTPRDSRGCRVHHRRRPDAGNRTAARRRDHRSEGDWARRRTFQRQRRGDQHHRDQSVAAGFRDGLPVRRGRATRVDAQLLSRRDRPERGDGQGRCRRVDLHLLQRRDRPDPRRQRIRRRGCGGAVPRADTRGRDASGTEDCRPHPRRRRPTSGRLRSGGADRRIAWPCRQLFAPRCSTSP